MDINGNAPTIRELTARACAQAQSALTSYYELGSIRANLIAGVSEAKDLELIRGEAFEAIDDFMGTIHHLAHVAEEYERAANASV